MGKAGGRTLRTRLEEPMATLKHEPDDDEQERYPSPLEPCGWRG